MKTTTVLYKQGMQAPFRRRSHLRILWNASGTPQAWTDDDIVTATITREVDPLARKIPTETISFGIIDYDGDYNASNPTGKWQTVDDGTEIHVQFGFDKPNGTTEWLDYDVYFLDGKPAYSKNIATFKASSRLNRLNRTTFYKAYATNNVSLKNMAELVLADAGVSSSFYSVDASLASIMTNTVFPLASHAATLQMIAHAAGCAVFTQGSKIYIAPIDIGDLTYHTFALTARDIVLGSHQTDRSEPLGKVLVKSHQFIVDANSSEIARYEATASGTATVHVEYPMAGGVSVSITGGTITSQTCYGCAADVTVSASGTFTLVFTGRKISTADTVYEYMVDVSADAEDIENNPILDGKGATLAANASAYFSKRVSDSFTYRGDPSIEPLDGVYLALENGEVYPAIVVKHTITYNGALSGKMTVRRVRNTQAKGMLLDKELVNVTDDDGQIYVRSYGYYKSAYTVAQMDAFVTSVLGA